MALHHLFLDQNPSLTESQGGTSEKHQLHRFSCARDMKNAENTANPSLALGTGCHSKWQGLLSMDLRPLWRHAVPSAFSKPSKQPAGEYMASVGAPRALQRLCTGQAALLGNKKD